MDTASASASDLKKQQQHYVKKWQPALPDVSGDALA
jgi:hypothetical protein